MEIIISSNSPDTMAIDYDLEIIEINTNLRQVRGYFDCEKIIIHNIKKQLNKGFDDENIMEYLKKLSACFDKKIKISQGKADCSNYRYARDFVDTLLQLPYWKSWIKTIDI